MTTKCSNELVRGASVARLLTGLLGVGRLALGTTAVTCPTTAAAAWTGPRNTRSPAVRVLGRAAGGRDIALGIGSLHALCRGDRDGHALASWLTAAAVADAVDVLVTIAHRDEIPGARRWAVLGAAGTATVTGAASAVLVRRPVAGN